MYRQAVDLRGPQNNNLPLQPRNDYMKFAGFVLLGSMLILAGCSRAPQRTPQSSDPTAKAESYPNLTARAQELMDAVAQKNYAKIVDLTYPKVIEVGGGREKLLAATTEEVKSMEAEGVVIISSTTSPPSQILHDGGAIFAVVPVTTKVKATDGTFQTEGSLIGISNDGGANWTFVDATGKDQTELKTVLPNLDKLNVPPEKAPVKIAS
jgi:hypothetical protein